MESGDGWKHPPTRDAYRVWHQTLLPDVHPDDDDYNWTTWLNPAGLREWFGPGGRFEVEWLPEGGDPLGLGWPEEWD